MGGGGGGVVLESLFQDCEYSFVALYCNFRSLPFFGFIGFLLKAAKSLIYSYPPECSQDKGEHPKA